MPADKFKEISPTEEKVKLSAVDPLPPVIIKPSITELILNSSRLSVPTMLEAVAISINLSVYEPFFTSIASPLIVTII